MGVISTARKQGKKVVLEILAEYEEYLQLQGHLHNIRLFTENTADIQTNISQRGKNAATKYFLIPRQFRKNLKFNNITSCQKMELEDKTIFIYVIDKTKTHTLGKEILMKKLEEKYKIPNVNIDSQDLGRSSLAIRKDL